MTTLEIVRAHEHIRGNRSLRFANSQVGWVVTSNGVLRTSDGGHSWQNRTPVGLQNEYLVPKAVHPLGSKNCWLVTSYAAKEARCFETLDAGQSWIERCRLFADKHNIFFEDLFFANETCGWLLLVEGDRRRLHSTLCRTDDGGQRWSKGPLRFSGRPQKMIFADPTIGWIAEIHSNRSGSKRTTLLHSSSDGGACWEKRSALTHEARDLCLAPSGDLFICGANGMIARSGDSGKTWELLESHTRMMLESIHFRGSVGIVGGTAQLVRSRHSVAFLLSRDSGRTWRRIESPIRASIQELYLTAWDRGVITAGDALYQFRILPGS
jgi:photosystem II stability/assembly factor-like uncharacterized protein